MICHVFVEHAIGWLAAGRLPGDGWRQLPQIGAHVPINVAASKETATFRGFVLGRIPSGLLDTDKVAGVLAPAVWARLLKIFSHLTLNGGMFGLKSAM